MNRCITIIILFDGPQFQTLFTLTRAVFTNLYRTIEDNSRNSNGSRLKPSDHFVMTFASKRNESSKSLLNTTDTFDYISIISKLKRLSDININPINKEKTYTSNNNSDVTIFKLPKPMDKIQEAREKNNSKQDNRIDKVAKNYKSDIMKVIGEIKRTLSKFKMKMHRLELENLKNEIVNECHAEHIAFIIGCNISKLKEELKDQEELLTMFCHQQSIQPKSKRLPFYKFGKLNHNRNNKDNSQSQSKTSRGRRSLDDATKMNNANCIWNDHVPIETKSQKNHENLTFEKSYTSTETILEANEKMALWEKQNRASILSEVTANVNWKRSTTIRSVSAIERIVPGQYPTTTKKNSLGNKLTSKNVQCARLSNNSDIYNTCSTVPLFPIKNNNVLKAHKVNKHIRICENKSRFYDRLKNSFSRTRLLGTHNVDKPQPTNLRSCNLQEIIIIPQNRKHETSTCNEQNTSIYSARCSKMDLEVESVNSSISSTFSAYIVPSISHNTKNGNSSDINPATITSNGGIVDKKIFMNCEVVLNKL